MEIQLSLSCTSPEDLRALSKMFAALGGAAVDVKPAPAQQPVVAPPMSAGPLTTPPVPTSPELRAKIDALTATNEAKATKAEPAVDPLEKRGRGRPRQPKGEAPVPRPPGGKYGGHTCPEDRDPTEYMAERKAAKRALNAVMLALSIAKVPYEKFFSECLSRYGDGVLSTVPNGNFEALLAEVKAGPKEHPLTEAELDAAMKEVMKQEQASAPVVTS